MSQVGSQTVTPSATEAAPATSTSTAADRAGAFRAVDGAGETVKGGNLLIAAYAVVWVVVLLLVVRTFRKQTQTIADLERLEASLKKGAGKP